MRFGSSKVGGWLREVTTMSTRTSDDVLLDPVKAENPPLRGGLVFKARRLVVSLNSRPRIIIRRRA